MFNVGLVGWKVIGKVLEYQENCAGRYFVDEGGSSSSEVCDVDRFMCIVLCEREDVRVLRHACHHVLVSPLFCLGQKLVALRVLDVSLGLVGCVGDSDLVSFQHLLFQQPHLKFFLQEQLLWGRL